MNPAHIDRLLAGLPADSDARHARRVDAYAATARRCDERIAQLRTEIDHALHAVATAPGPDAADTAIALTCELDSLERVQPRIDSWLRDAVGAVSDSPGQEPFGEGPN